MKRMSFVMAFLITGYALGIWNYILLPKVYINTGLMGVFLSLLMTLIVVYAVYLEVESTRRTKYLAYEFLRKVAERPRLVYTFLGLGIIFAGILAYYGFYGFSFVYFNGSPYVTAFFAILTIAGSALLLVVFRGKIIKLLSALSILFILFTVLSAVLIIHAASGAITSPKAVQYTHSTLSSMFSTTNVGVEWEVLYALVGVVLAFGLGVGAYYVVGSFSPYYLNIKRVMSIVLVLQLIISFAASITTAYAIGFAYQGYVNAQNEYNKIYVEEGRIVHNMSATPNPQKLSELFKKLSELNSSLRKIKVRLVHFEKVKRYVSNKIFSPFVIIEGFYDVPRVIEESDLPGAGTVSVLLLLSIYLASLTTIIVLIEIMGQLVGEVTKYERSVNLSIVTLNSSVLTALMLSEAFRKFLVAVLLYAAVLIASFELQSVLKLDFFKRRSVLSIFAFMLVVGIIAFLRGLQSGLIPAAGALTGLVLLMFGLGRKLSKGF